jgi:hypothetical protein
MGASVRARLLTLAREKGQALDLLLTRYATERLLYRLSTTPHRASCRSYWIFLHPACVRTRAKQLWPRSFRQWFYSAWPTPE